MLQHWNQACINKINLFFHTNYLISFQIHSYWTIIQNFERSNFAVVKKSQIKTAWTADKRGVAALRKWSCTQVYGCNRCRIGRIRKVIKPFKARVTYNIHCNHRFVCRSIFMMKQHPFKLPFSKSRITVQCECT